MKKIFVFAAAAAFALCACDKTGPQVDGSGDKNDEGNNAATVESVVLNELCGNKVYDGNKFIELYNGTKAEVDLSGWTIRKYAADATDVAGKYNNCWIAPAGAKLGAGQYLVLEADQEDPSKGFKAGLSAKKGVKFELVDASGKVVDLFLRGEDADPFAEESFKDDERKDASFSRVPNGTGDWAYADPTPGAANGESTGEIKGYKKN